MMMTDFNNPYLARRRRPGVDSGTLLVTGIILPAFWLLLLALSEPWASWQSGDLRAYAGLLLTGKASMLFWPFVAFSMTCFAYAYFRPAVAGRHLLLRLGVYAGILLAMQYGLVFGLVLFDVDTIAKPAGVAKILAIPVLACVTIAVPRAVGWLWRRFLDDGRHDLGEWSWVALVLVFVVVLAAPLSLLIALALTVISTPYWALAAYASVARNTIRASGGRLQFNLREVLAGMTWLAAYLATWRFAVRQALEAYAQLPTTPTGNCYVASAAAHGHVAFVGSQTVVCATGVDRRVNLQLKWLKCGEIALHTTSPSAHRRLRRVYDRWGPAIAARLRNPWLADAAYLGLKPIEWPMRAVLSILLPEARQLTERLYSQNPRVPRGGQDEFAPGRKLRPWAASSGD